MEINNSIKSSKLASAILIIISLVFVVIAIGFNIYGDFARDNWYKATAVIKEVNHFDETINISYNYEGENYLIEPLYYSSTFKVGDLIVIFINPNSPEDVYIENMDLLFIIFYIVSGVMALISLILYIVSKNKDKIIKECIEYGYKKTLEVTEVKRSYTYNKGKTHYYLVVKYQEKEYKSDLFTLASNNGLEEKYLVDVYFLENGNYYIKLDSCRKKELLEF